MGALPNGYVLVNVESGDCLTLDGWRVPATEVSEAQAIATQTFRDYPRPWKVGCWFVQPNGTGTLRMRADGRMD